MLLPHPHRRRVLLITDPLSPEDGSHRFMVRRRWVPRWLKPLPSTMPCYSLLYLAPGLARAGFEVEYLDTSIEPRDRILERIAVGRPLLAGLSSLTSNWRRTCDLARQIKRCSPDTFTVAGGVHVSAVREAALRECEALDAAVVGDGEGAIVEIAERVRDRASPAGVLGVLSREGDRVVSSSARPPEDLDRLPPPDRGLVDMSFYRPSEIFSIARPHDSVFGARGCPYRCIFCHTDPKVRFRDPLQVVDEIGDLVRSRGVRDVSFWDDIFTLKPERAARICEELLRRGIRVAWSVNARGDLVDPALLLLMRRAGCWRVLYGIESGVQKNVDVLRKGLSLDRLAESVRLTRAVGIESLGMFVFGIPGETFEEGLETIRFARTIGLDYAYFTHLTPLPGTELWDRAAEWGTIIEDAPLDVRNVSFIPRTMNRDQMEELMRRAWTQFYLRPGYVGRRLRTIRAPRDVVRNARVFLTLLFSSGGEGQG